MTSAAQQQVWVPLSALSAVCQEVGTSLDTIRRLVKSGDLPGRRGGSSSKVVWYVERAAITVYLRGVSGRLDCAIQTVWNHAVASRASDCCNKSKGADWKKCFAGHQKDLMVAFDDSNALFECEPKFYFFHKVLIPALEGVISPRNYKELTTLIRKIKKDVDDFVERHIYLFSEEIDAIDVYEFLLTKRAFGENLEDALESYKFRKVHTPGSKKEIQEVEVGIGNITPSTNCQLFPSRVGSIECIEDKMALHKVLDVLLDVDEMEILWLHLEGYTLEEINEMAGLGKTNMGSVKYMITKIEKRIADYLSS